MTDINDRLRENLAKLRERVKDAPPVDVSEWLRNQPEAIRKREYMAQWWEANHDRKAQYNARWRKDNHEYDQQRHIQWYENNRESILQKQAQQHEELRDWAFRCLGGKCSHCECNNQDVLVVDHILGGGNNEDKEFGSRSRSALYRRIINHRDPHSKWQLLCACCNEIKAYNNNERKSSGMSWSSILAHELRLEILYNLGNFCRYCGWNEDLRALHIDHIHNNGGEERDMYKASYQYYLNVLNNLSSGYQILCPCCHAVKTRTRSRDGSNNNS